MANGSVTMSVVLRKLRNGLNGTPGQSTFKAIVFKRIAPGATVNPPSGGSFLGGNWIPPTGWSDGIPAEDGNPCYMSTRVFTSDGRAPQEPAWSFPVLNSDTSGYDVCFSSITTWPTPPTNHGTQSDSIWHENGTSEDRWMAQSWCRNGVWTDWTISKIKGEDGASATIKGTAIAHYPNMAEFNASHETKGVYLVDDGSQPKTMTVANSVTSQNASVGDGWFIDGDLWVCTEDGWKNAGHFKGDTGPKGDDAKYVVVTSEQAFVYKDDFTGSPTPTSITITAKLYGGLTTRVWSYRRADQSSFSTISGQTGETLSVSPTSTAYWGSSNTVRSCTFRCTSNGFYDEITIVKVSSGKSASAYTIVLTNESHTFTGESGHAIAGSAECEVIAYKNDTKIAVNITDISGKPTGMTTSISGNNTTAAKFTVNVTTSLTQKCGTLVVSMTVDGKQFQKAFSWSLSLKGDVGIGTNGKNAFEVAVTPLVLDTDDKGRIQYSSGATTLNEAHITATYGGATVNVSVNGVVSVYNCLASARNTSASSSTNTDVGVVITDIPHTDYDANGNITENESDVKYSIPATSGYAVVSVALMYTPTRVSETKNVTVPWSVNYGAHFGTLIANDHRFESTIGSISANMDEVTTQISAISQTSQQIKLTVGQMSKERRNLLWRSKLSLVDYRAERGVRTATLSVRKTYLLSVKATPSSALLASVRKLTPDSPLQRTGYLATLFTDPNNNVTEAIAFHEDNTEVGYAVIEPTTIGEYRFYHSDLPQFSTSGGGVASTYSQHYLVEWEQLEDITERLPAGWSSMTDAEKRELAPLLATPWSLSDDEREVNTNLLNIVDPTYNSALYSHEDVTLPDGNKVKGFYQCSTDTTASSRDLCFDVTDGIRAGEVYTLSFWAMGDYNGTTKRLTSICNASIGAFSPTAYAVASISKMFQGYSGGSASVTSLIGSEWRLYVMSFTASRDSSASNPVRFTACRASGFTFHIAAIKLEEGGRASYGDGDALYHTGIDITNRKIELTADNIAFRDNQGNLSALVRGDGITSQSFIALNSDGKKMSSLNENGDGALIQYHADGFVPKFVFGNDGITCYEEDGTIKWFIGMGGVNGSTDDWIPYDKYQVTDEENGVISTVKVTKYLFRCGSGSANRQFDGLYFDQRNVTSNRVAGRWAGSTAYGPPPVPQTGQDVYFQLYGQTTRRKVYYVRSYGLYVNGDLGGRIYTFYYDINKTCLGNSNPLSTKYGTIVY